MMAVQRIVLESRHERNLTSTLQCLSWMSSEFVQRSVRQQLNDSHAWHHLNEYISPLPPTSSAPLSPSFLPPSLFSGQWKCACVQILSAVCNFWLWWRASAQPRASGFAAQPQSRHMKNCWVRAGFFLPLCECALVCIWTVNERWFILRVSPSFESVSFSRSLYTLRLFTIWL